MALNSRDITIVKGKTFKLVIHWETDPIIYKAITAISQTAPMRVTAPGHGMPDGWPGAITNVKGMIEVNADANNVRESDRKPVTFVDANNIDINSVDASGFKPYISGGYIQYRTPVDLSVFSKARNNIKAKAGNAGSVRLRCSAITTGVAGSTKPTGAQVDGGVTWVTTTNPTTKEWIAGATYAVNDVIDLMTLLFLSTENGRIILDNTKRTITLLVSANDTASIDWTKAVHELELIKPGGSYVTDEVVAVVPVSKVVVTEESTN